VHTRDGAQVERDAHRAGHDIDQVRQGLDLAGRPDDAAADLLGEALELDDRLGRRQRGVVGNIYKGRVTRVLPGMQSAFVDIGLEKDAFLYVADVGDEVDDFDRFGATGDAPETNGNGLDTLPMPAPKPPSLYESMREMDRLHRSDDDLIGNVRRAAVADWAFYVQRLPGPVDMSDWGMTPQTNDAYNGSLRDIVFPAGILQPPMFDANADPAVNYGAIGGVIGHELSHGFDDQGRKFDADGKLNDWWTAEDAKTFEARAKILGEQYSKFEPLPGAKVNGELTMGENIAARGGVVIALDAYRASLKGKPAPVIDGLTGEQRVLLGWAQAWRGKLRDDAVRRQVVSDPHSPRQYRVNGVMRNIDAWYDAFKVKADEKLFIDPKGRVRIW